MTSQSAMRLSPFGPIRCAIPERSIAKAREGGPIETERSTRPRDRARRGLDPDRSLGVARGARGIERALHRHAVLERGLHRGLPAQRAVEALEQGAERR